MRLKSRLRSQICGCSEIVAFVLADGFRRMAKTIRNIMKSTMLPQAKKRT
jgi:hypothetical protein